MRLAADTFQDATGFVAILEANGLLDTSIAGPIAGIVSAAASAGGQTLSLAPVEGIQVGDFVYADFVSGYSVVTSVTQVRTVETPFAFADQPPPAPGRVLPPAGAVLYTEVTVSPAIAADATVGESVTFAVGEPVEIIVPPTPTTGGLP